MKHPLKQLREKYGFTQCDIAVIANTHQPHIAELEAGGLKVNKRILKIVEELSEDKSKFLEQETAFRKLRRLKLLERAS